MGDAIEKDRYYELVEKIIVKEQSRLVTKYLEAKLETLKNRFLIEDSSKLEPLQMVAIEIESMISDLKVIPVPDDEI